MIRPLVLALVLLLPACAADPVPFETGAEVAPPRGCVEYRIRGGVC